MEHQPRTERKDRAEQLRKMKFELRYERSSKDPVMTADEVMFVALQRMACDLAYIKLSFLEKEDSFREDEAQIGKVEARQRQAELACMWQEYAKLEEKLGFSQMRSRESKKAAKLRESQSNVQKHAKSVALVADASSNLGGLVTCLAHKEKKILSETPEVTAETQDDTPREEAEAEHKTPFKEEETEDDAHGKVAEAENDTPSKEEETELDAHGAVSEAEGGTPSEEEETEDDIRLKGLFAQMENLFAQYKSLGLGAEFEARHHVFLKRLDEEKARSLRDAAIRDGLDWVQGTS